MSKPKATEKTVFAAAESLLQDGLSPRDITNRKILDLTDGSLTTISPLLNKWKDKIQALEILGIEMPLELANSMDIYTRDSWSIALKLAREHFREEISDYINLKDDLDLCMTELTDMKNQNQQLSDDLSMNTQRFVTVINDTKEVFHNQAGIIKNAIAEGDIERISVTFDSLYEQLNSQLKKSLDDQQSILSHYINTQEIGNPDTEETEEKVATLTDLKQDSQRIEDTVDEAKKIV